MENVEVNDIDEDKFLFILTSNESQDSDDVIISINRALYERDDYASTENQLQQQFGTGGACPAQWESHSIAFKCSDCEKDQSCAVCADCFFNSDHTNHAFRMIRTVGGCCDCGDPSSWDVKGYCNEHQGVTEFMDGPEAFAAIPNRLGQRCQSFVKVATNLLKKEIDECRPEWIASIKGKLTTCKNLSILRADSRVYPLLKWCQHIASVAFGFRYLINQGLEDDFLQNIILHHFDFPANVQKGLHNLILSLLVSPSFKRRFAEILVRYYVHALSGCYNMLPYTMNEQQSDSMALYSLTVQLFTVPELAMASLLEWDLLHTICVALRDLLSVTENRPVDFTNFSRKKQFDVSRMLIDLRYLFHHPSVINFFIDENVVGTSNEPRTSFFSDLIELLKSLHFMNPQNRLTDVHIAYENANYEEAFRVEFDLLKALSVMIQSCKRPLPLQRIIGLYTAVANAVRQLPQRSDEWMNKYSFHIPLIRFFTSIVDKHLLFRLMEEAELNEEEQQLLDVFDQVLAERLLEASLSCLLFASEIERGYWVRNGRVMKNQRSHYIATQLAPIDLESVQLAIRIFGYLQRGKNEIRKRSQGIDSVDNFSNTEWKLDPFCRLFVAVFDISKGRGTLESVTDIWIQIYQVMSYEGQIKMDHETRVVSDSFRVNFIFELLGRSINHLFFMETASIPRKILPAEYETRGVCVLRREVVQRLAVQDTSFSLLEQFVKTWKRHPRFEETVEEVAEFRNVGTTASQATTLLRLRPDRWKLYDAFWPPMSQKDTQQVEEEALKHRNADLIGPTRLDSRMSSHFEFLQDSIVTAFGQSVLGTIVLKCLSCKRAHMMFPLRFKSSLVVRITENKREGDSNPIESCDVSSEFLDILTRCDEAALEKVLPFTIFSKLIVKAAERTKLICPPPLDATVVEDELVDSLPSLLSQTIKNNVIEFRLRSPNVSVAEHKRVLAEVVRYLQRKKVTDSSSDDLAIEAIKKEIKSAPCVHAKVENKAADEHLADAFKLTVAVLSDTSGESESDTPAHKSKGVKKLQPEFLLPHLLKIVDVLHQAQEPKFPESQVTDRDQQMSIKRKKADPISSSRKPSFFPNWLMKEIKKRNSLLIDLAFLSRMENLAPLTRRCVDALNYRLQNFYNCAVSLENDKSIGNAAVVPLSDLTGATTTLTFEGQVREKELDEAKLKQLEVLADMQKQQAKFLDLMKWELESEEEEEIGETENQAERALECVMCREKGTKTNPLGQIIYVTTSNVLRRAAVSGPTAFPHSGPVLTSCGHIGHITCLDRHRKAMRSRKRTGEFFFADVISGQFPCPVCRSLGNGIMPYLPLSAILLPEEGKESNVCLPWAPSQYTTRSSLRVQDASKLWDLSDEFVFSTPVGEDQSSIQASTVNREDIRIFHRLNVPHGSQASPSHKGRPSRAETSEHTASAVVTLQNIQELFPGSTEMDAIELEAAGVPLEEGPSRTFYFDSSSDGGMDLLTEGENEAFDGEVVVADQGGTTNTSRMIGPGLGNLAAFVVNAVNLFATRTTRFDTSDPSELTEGDATDTTTGLDNHVPGNATSVDNNHHYGLATTQIMNEEGSTMTSGNATESAREIPLVDSSTAVDSSPFIAPVPSIDSNTTPHDDSVSSNSSSPNSPRPNSFVTNDLSSDEVNDAFDGNQTYSIVTSTINSEEARRTSDDQVLGPLTRDEHRANEQLDIVIERFDRDIHHLIVSTDRPLGHQTSPVASSLASATSTIGSMLFNRLRNRFAVANESDFQVPPVPMQLDQGKSQELIASCLFELQQKYNGIAFSDLKRYLVSVSNQQELYSSMMEICEFKANNSVSDDEESPPSLSPPTQVSSQQPSTLDMHMKDCRMQLIDPLDGNVFANQSVPSESWCISALAFYAGVPLMSRHAATLEYDSALHWIILTEILLSAEMRESRIVMVDRSPIPPHILAIRNAIISRPLDCHRAFTNPLCLSYWFGVRSKIQTGGTAIPSHVTNPWAADIRQEFLWGFINGEMNSMKAVQIWCIDLMAIRAIQLLEEVVIDMLIEEERPDVGILCRRLSNNDELPDEIPIEVLENILTHWLKDTGMVAINDLEIGVRWDRRQRKDAIYNHFDDGNQNDKKRHRSETANFFEENSSKKKSLFLHDLNRKRGDSAKNVEYYLKRIEKMVIEDAQKRYSTDKNLTRTQSEDNNKPNEESPKEGSDGLSIQSSKVLEPVTEKNCTLSNNKIQSGAEESCQSRFVGSDKMKRLELQLAKAVAAAVPAESLTAAKTRASKLFWTLLLEIFPHCPHVIDLIDKHELNSQLGGDTTPVTIEKLFKAVVTLCWRKRLGDHAKSFEDEMIKKWWSVYFDKLIESLRRFGVFVCWVISAIWMLSSSDRNRIAYPTTDLVQHFKSIMGILGISPRFDLIDSTLIRRAIDIFWNSVFLKHIKVCRLARVETRPPSFDSLSNLKLIDLPNLYLEVVKQTYKRACAECGQQPTEPALCLLCGAIVCVDSPCCKTVSGEGECTRHARDCGGGQGLFMLTHLSLNLGIDAPRCCFFECPYVDRHGEPNSRHGKPLILSERRLNESRQMLFFGEIGREIINTNERTGRYISRPL